MEGTEGSPPQGGRQRKKEYIPERGDLALHEPTSQIIFIIGWIDKEHVAAWTLPEKKVIALIYQEGDFEVVFTAEQIKGIDVQLPLEISIAKTQPS